jgi:hypothetical protein
MPVLIVMTLSGILLYCVLRPPSSPDRNPNVEPAQVQPQPKLNVSGIDISKSAIRANPPAEPRAGDG